MADGEEVPDTQPTNVKPPSLDIESLQRKKFKTDELPLAPAQHSAIQSLLHSFKKKGGFDSVRKGIFEEFNNGVLQCLQFSYFVDQSLTVHLHRNIRRSFSSP